jgi:hypothetical protein
VEDTAVSRLPYLTISFVLCLLAGGHQVFGQEPPSDKEARARFLAVKKQLARVVAGIPNTPDRLEQPGVVEEVESAVELARMTGPKSAKVTVVVYLTKNKKRIVAARTFTIRLSYYKGAWTTTDYVGDWEKGNNITYLAWTRHAHLVMLAIDKMSE